MGTDVLDITLPCLAISHLSKDACGTLCGISILKIEPGWEMIMDLLLAAFSVGTRHGILPALSLEEINELRATCKGINAIVAGHNGHLRYC